MTYTILEAGIMIFIVASMGFFGWLIRKNGAANPVGTAVLQRDVGNLRNKVDGIGVRLDGLDRDMASAKDVERVQDALETEKGKIERVFTAVERVDEEITEIAKSLATRNLVVEAIAESVRNVSTELKSYQSEVNAHLSQVKVLAEKTEANKASILEIVNQLPGIRDKQNSMAEDASATREIAKRSEASIDRIEQILLEKAFK